MGAVIAVMWGGYGGGWGWGAGLAMGVGMVVFWGLVIAGGVALVRYLAAGRDRPSGTRDALSEAERILADRFARGEIDEDEFRRRSALLRSGR